jgi:hypothetical protein
MSRFVIVPVCCRHQEGYLWRWQSLDGSKRSQFCFEYFYDCMEAARNAGVEVDIEKSKELAKRPEFVKPSEYRIGPANGARR